MLKNIRLKTNDGMVDKKSWKILKDFVMRRMNKELIHDRALTLSIDYSGGVFRTLVDLIASAAVHSKTFGGSKIDEGSMEEAIREAKVNKSRPSLKSTGISCWKSINTKVFSLKWIMKSWNFFTVFLPSNILMGKGGMISTPC